MSVSDEFYLDCNNYIPLTSGRSCTSALNILVDKNSYQELSLSINGQYFQFTQASESETMFIVTVSLLGVGTVIAFLSIFCFSSNNCVGY